MPEIRKKLSLEVMTTRFVKFRQNPQILKSRISVSNFKTRVWVSECLMKSRPRSFDHTSVSKFTVSTTFLLISLQVLCLASYRVEKWKMRKSIKLRWCMDGAFKLCE